MYGTRENPDGASVSKKKDEFIGTDLCYLIDFELAKPEGPKRPFALPVYKQCTLLGIPRSSFYYWKNHHEEQERLKMELFAEEKAFAEIVMGAWVKYPTYGYRKMSRYLQRKEHPEATEKRVRRIYKMLGLQGLAPVFKTTRSSKGKEKKFPYLLRNRKISFVNEVWATDYSDNNVFPMLY